MKNDGASWQVTPELWPTLEDLFGKPGASNGCRCMYWRSGGAYRERSKEESRRDLEALIRRGRLPGCWSSTERSWWAGAR